MALRHLVTPKHTADRHETDYERWLKDQDDAYEPAGEPRYHPTNAGTARNDQDDRPNLNTIIPHSQLEDTFVDDEGSAIQVSRGGSILFPVNHSKGSGHQTSPTENLLPGIGLKESMVCCGFIIVSVVALLGICWSAKMRRQRRRGEKYDTSQDWVDDEKKELLEEA
ncbi:hypothetical protein F1880_000121 [Penicillium rolfsii]|nr:hypothetical protein F1880_000121 [Penicillium rolfsii]